MPGVKSDKKTGCELDAAASVVFGGKSITGCFDTVLGTIIGLFIIGIIGNGSMSVRVGSEI